MPLGRLSGVFRTGRTRILPPKPLYPGPEVGADEALANPVRSGTKQP